MNICVKVCLIPLAVVEAIIGGIVFTAACLVDFWVNETLPFSK